MRDKDLLGKLAKLTAKQQEDLASFLRTSAATSAGIDLSDDTQDQKN